LAGNAEAALDGTGRQERGLERVEAIAGREALDRRDRGPVGLDAEHQA
jgi:hypothetical protein